MKSAIAAVLLCLVSAIGTSGQAQVQTVPVAITSDYYAKPKVLVLHALNNSGKDIAGYTIIIGHKNADGKMDQGRTWTATDMLSVLITAQMAKDPAASESIRQQYLGNKIFNDAGTGIFFAGRTRDITLTGIDSGSEFDAAAGVIFYADGTYDRQDEDTFKQMLASRQHELQRTTYENELIRNALADPANEHPVTGVLTELNKRRVEEMDKPGQHFPMDLSNSELRSMQQPLVYGPDKGKSERERLTQYVQDQEKRVELMTPHCHLEIALKP